MNTTYSPGEPGQWTVVGVARGVGTWGTMQQSHDPPLAKSGLFSWKFS